MRRAGFRFKPQLAFEVLSIIIHVIIAVASCLHLWQFLEIPLIRSDICFGFQTCATVSIGLTAICLS